MDSDAAAILGALATLRLRGAPIVLIDGGSGAGKTDLARRLAPALGAETISLDDFCPGWDGLETASRMVVSDVLAAGRWRRWDWMADAPAEWHTVDRSRPLVIEGSGALSRASRPLASLGVWLDVDAATRQRRALERDGDRYTPFWDRWAEQEAAFFERERPDLLADVILSRRQS